VNKYIRPSGAEKRAERERLFTNAVPVLMPPTARDMILTGEFDSTIDKSDSTGQNNTNRALATLIRGCYLCDVWDTAQNRTGYTYYVPKAASRIHILRRNCLLKQVIEGKIKGEMEVTRRRGRRRKKLLDDIKDRRGYSHLKEETLGRTMWRHRFGGDFGPVGRQNTE